jgi:hypothetical protein
MNIRRIATATAFVFATLLVGLPVHAATQSDTTQNAAAVTVSTTTPIDWPWG